MRRWLSSLVSPPSHLSGRFGDLVEGFTPLDVAIRARNWETAKVIIAIANAQYEEPAATAGRDNCDGKLIANVPSHSSFYPPEEHDEEHDEDSDLETDDDISDQLNRKAEIMDISHRVGPIRVPVGPGALFQASPYSSKDSILYWEPLEAAVRAADIEATKQIFALYELCDPPLLDDLGLDHILPSDSPAMLDFFIRKSGIGLGVSEEEEDDPQEIEKPRTYLGLDVHGVKRKDLAKRNDPDAPQWVHRPYHIPLLWSAATEGATKILDWLATPAPLDAYKAFISSASDEDITAKALRTINDLGTQLPELLGFLPNELGETAVLAALVGKQKEEQKLATVKQLYNLSPHLKNTFTASRIKGAELTSILLVCATNCGKGLFDFFLSHGANPMDVDHRGCVVLIYRRFL